MNAKNRKIKTRFGPEIRFELRPLPTASARRRRELALEQLKERLLARLLEANLAEELAPQLRRAVNEAASLAWATPVPLLVLPVLAEELAQRAQQRFRKQKAILNRSRNLLKVAA